MAGGALAEVKVAGPHEVQRRGVIGARAGGLLEVPAAAGVWRWSVVVGPKRGAQSRVPFTRPSRKVIAAKTRRMAFGVLGRKAPWAAADVIAPLEAGERVVMCAAAVFSAWPPALLELVAYLLSGLAVLLRRSAS